MVARSGSFAVAFWVLTSLTGLSQASAADLPMAPSTTYFNFNYADPVDRWEARFGVFAHGLHQVERGTVSLNGEIVSPRLFQGSLTGFYSWFLPRIHAGGSVNLGGRTSYIYTGLLWTATWTERFFSEIYVGPSVHNGSLNGAPGLAALGCRALVHAGVNFGYRFTPQWSAMLTYEHMSNASDISGCPRNQALDNVGLRVSYSF
jgi:lipid A 3-O-deacylase